MLVNVELLKFFMPNLYLHSDFKSVSRSDMLVITHSRKVNEIRVLQK
jgi:hypothetical protein